MKFRVFYVRRNNISTSLDIEADDPVKATDKVRAAFPRCIITKVKLIRE